METYIDESVVASTILEIFDSSDKRFYHVREVFRPALMVTDHGPREMHPGIVCIHESHLFDGYARRESFRSPRLVLADVAGSRLLERRVSRLALQRDSTSCTRLRHRPRLPFRVQTIALDSPFPLCHYDVTALARCRSDIRRHQESVIGFDLSRIARTKSETREHPQGQTCIPFPHEFGKGVRPGR